MGDKVVPLLAAVVVLLGVWRRVPVYDVFVRGAKEGLKTAASIAPFLIAILPRRPCCNRRARWTRCRRCSRPRFRICACPRRSRR